MGNCLITQKGGAISDDEFQTFAHALSFSRRDSTVEWEFLGTNNTSVTFEKRTFVRMWTNNRFEYKFFDKGTHTLTWGNMWGVDPASGYEKYFYKYIGGYLTLLNIYSHLEMRCVMGNALLVRKGDTALAQVENYNEVAYRCKVSSAMMNCITNNSGTEATVLNYPTITKTYFKMINQTVTFLKSGKYRIMNFRNSYEKITDEIISASANQTYIVDDTNAITSMCIIYHLTD